MKMSETRELQNQRAHARLMRALPEHFPAPVLTYALNRRWTPPMPRLAVDGYWRAHPLRADRLTRALARRSGTPEGWTWRLKDGAREGFAGQLSRAARAVSREGVLARTGLLLRVRPAGLPARLARGPVGSRTEQECDLAHGLRHRHGGCGMRRAITRSCCGGCSSAAAPRPARGCGRPAKSIIACRCSGCGASIATWTGRRSSRSGDCPTCRSSTATPTRRNAPPRL